MFLVFKMADYIISLAAKIQYTKMAKLKNAIHFGYPEWMNFSWDSARLSVLVCPIRYESFLLSYISD